MAERCFDDFDDLRAYLWGWNLELCQLDRGPFRGEIRQAGIDSASLVEARFDRRLEQRGDPPPGHWTFGIPAEDCPAFVWRRQRVGPGDVLVVDPETELEAAGPGGFHVFTFSVPVALLDAVTSIGRQSEAREALTGGRSFRLALESWTPVIRRLHELSGRLDQEAELLDAEGRRSIEFDLLSQLVDGIAAGEGAEMCVRGRVRDRVIERAESFLRENERAPSSQEELCRATEASPRTLRRAFLERFGVSPSNYLKARRLNGVRSDLRGGDTSTTTVRDVAFRWGFWHMGQFSADYRQHFGELPSVTLRSRGVSLEGVSTT